MRPQFVLAVVLAFATASVVAQRVGNEAPDITWEKAFGFGDVPSQKLSDLRGSVVLLSFYTTGSTACIAEIPRLNKLFANKAEEGLVVVGVTGDDPNLVRAYMSRHQVKFPIGVGQQREYSVKQLPEVILVDKEGKIAWRGHPAALDATQLDALLVGAKPAVVVAGLESIQPLRQAKNFGEAWQKTKELLAGGALSERAQAQAKDWMQATEQFVTAAMAAADKAEAAGDLHTLWASLDPVASSYQGVPGADTAKARLEKLLADPKAGREIEVGKKLAEAKVREAAFDFDGAYELYKAAATGFANTKGGKAAAAAMRTLEKDGKLGYVHTCGYCKAGGAACPQHRKKKK